MEKVISAFCAPEQKDTAHRVAVKNNEIILTCTYCNSFVKFPSELSNVEIQALIDAERVANLGKIPDMSATIQQEKDEKRLASF